MFPKWEHSLVEVSTMDFLIFMVLVLVLLTLLKAFMPQIRGEYDHETVGVFRPLRRDNKGDGNGK
jgi:hypothetical protein